MERIFCYEPCVWNLDVICRGSSVFAIVIIKLNARIVIQPPIKE